MVAFLLLGLTSANRDINALPLLLPLVALGAGSVENLKRDIAAALSWFWRHVVWYYWRINLVGLDCNDDGFSREATRTYAVFCLGLIALNLAGMRLSCPSSLV